MRKSVKQTKSHSELSKRRYSHLSSTINLKINYKIIKIIL